MSSLSGLSALSRAGGSNAAATRAAVARPRFRWGTRIIVPIVILAATAALLLWSARAALGPRMDVRVVPVILKPRGIVPDSAEPGEQSASTSAGPEQVIAQAPGWFEPDPFAVGVAALTDGIVKDVLVLEGHRVEADQVVVQLIDDDARLSLELAQATLAEREADIDAAQAGLAAAEARAAEVRDEVERKRALTDDGTIAAAIVARLELRLRGLEAEVTAARAGVAVARAARATQAVFVSQAQLAFDRTQIRTPVAGVVLSRMVEPGSRIAMAGTKSGDSSGSEVLRLYDPARLQVRVDVPLADAAKIGIGTRAKITSETLPDVEFRGEVMRIVHQADIERNTVQFKVSVIDPHEALKPEMLARVRFVSRGSGSVSSAGSSSSSADGQSILLIDSRGLIDRSTDVATVWLVVLDRRGGTTAAKRRVTLGAVHDDGFVEVLEGLLPTDRAVIDPPAAMAEGMTIHIVAEAGLGEGEDL